MLARHLALSRTLLLFVVFAHVAWAQAVSGPSVRQSPVETPKRVLFVGNSYMYYNDSLHNHVRRMAIAGDGGLEKLLHYKSATIGGAPLGQHDIVHLVTPGRLGVKQPFEIVILQGNSTDALSAPKRAAFREKVIEFDAEIRKRGGRAALYMTHAHVEPSKYASPDMIRKVEDMYVSVGNEVDALVIPVGLAFEEAYRRRPAIRLHKAYDGSHPSLIGTYLAACVVYESLYGKSPVGNPYDYFGAVERDDAAFLQEVAHETVRKFYGREAQ